MVKNLNLFITKIGVLLYCFGIFIRRKTATIPIYRKAGLLEGFSEPAFEMVMLGTIARMAPHMIEDADSVIKDVIEVYSPLCIAPEKYRFSEIFCKWWGDIMLGIGPVKRVQVQRSILIYILRILAPHFNSETFYV